MGERNTFHHNVQRKKLKQNNEIISTTGVTATISAPASSYRSNVGKILLSSCLQENMHLATFHSTGQLLLSLHGHACCSVYIVLQCSCYHQCSIVLGGCCRSLAWSLGCHPGMYSYMQGHMHLYNIMHVNVMLIACTQDSFCEPHDLMIMHMQVGH